MVQLSHSLFGLLAKASDLMVNNEMAGYGNPAIYQIPNTSLLPHRSLESGISSLRLFICDLFPLLCRRYGGFGAG